MADAERRIVDVRSIATPIEDCVALIVGEVQPDVLTRLQEGDFDQAPVLDLQGQPIGVLDAEIARRLLESRTPLDPESATIFRERLPFECPARDLLGLLARTHGVLVEDNGRVGWLVTVSDLNRHRFRSVLYGIFAELEALLARLIDVGHEDPWDWLSRLREDVQARLVGYWEVSKRRGVNIGPQAGATISELLSIVADSDQLRRFMRYRSRSAFRDDAGALPDHRNRVMHPVRPLVLDCNEVAALRTSVDRCEGLIERTRRALAERGYGSRIY